MTRRVICRTRRMALGLTQKQVAELAGVSATAVSRFEQGEDTSLPYVRSICKAVDDEMARLSREKWAQVNLVAQIMQLAEEDTNEDKLITLSYIHKSVSNIQIDILKAMKEVNKERS